MGESGIFLLFLATIYLGAVQVEVSRRHSGLLRASRMNSEPRHSHLAMMRTERPRRNFHRAALAVVTPSRRSAGQRQVGQRLAARNALAAIGWSVVIAMNLAVVQVSAPFALGLAGLAWWCQHELTRWRRANATLLSH